MRVRDVPPGVVPYISMSDLIVFKISSCGLRADTGKKRKDATDAQQLLESTTQDGPLSLSPIQKKTALEGLQDVVGLSDFPETWWEVNLGVTAK